MSTTNLPAPVPQTLREILTAMQDFDEDCLGLEISPEMLRDLLEMKVDSYKNYLDYLQALSDMFKKKAAAFTEAKRFVEGRLESLLAYMQHHMKENGFERLPGKDYECVPRKSEGVVFKREPTVQDVAFWSGFVRVKVEWRAQDTKDALKAGMNLPFAEIEKRENVTMASFKIRKEKK